MPNAFLITNGRSGSANKNVTVTIMNTFTITHCGDVLQELTMFFMKVWRFLLLKCNAKQQRRVINPRGACAAIICVFCLSGLLLYITSRMIVRLKNYTAYLTDNKVKKFVHFSLKILRCRDMASFACHNSVYAFTSCLWQPRLLY